jgi:2-polyprenyl-3-methyl-5-hydroxy-6-metoxy-1,4-benzoquinol methylase
VSYDPAVFRDVDTVERAKGVILNPDGVHTVDERWELETRWLFDKVASWMPAKGATCLDYGCGIGRLAKPLIEERGWSVMGVDISAAMRGMAVGYVASPRFLACAPGALDQLLGFGLRLDFAVAIWSLQHCERPTEDVERIRKAVKPGGRIFVMNALQRFVPTSDGRQFEWTDDGLDVWKMLPDTFVPLRAEPVPTDVVPSPPSVWGVFERVAE